MARRVHGTGGVVRSSTRYVPHLVMILAQLCFVLMSFITEAAMDMELNSYVYVTYRHLLVAVLIWPFAYYFEKGLRPKMTFMLFLENCHF
uniref:WAT1-related protein n=1 Tax=Saccharum spontaneum TaxID=62335 RepID=A0A678TH25_SACSP|nr:WAT1-related protein [Saccharum spontaneum]